MSKRPSKHRRAPRPLVTGLDASTRTTREGIYIVRTIPAHRALKLYMCPGCNTTIQLGTAHIVAWPQTPSFGFESGTEQRRHWHKHCWEVHT